MVSYARTDSADEAPSSFVHCGKSIIACAWPALALRAPDSMPSSQTTPSMTFYEMMRTGRMDKAIGGIDHIEIIERDNGDAHSSSRRPCAESVLMDAIFVLA